MFTGLKLVHCRFFKVVFVTGHIQSRHISLVFDSGEIRDDLKINGIHRMRLAILFYGRLNDTLHKNYSNLIDVLGKEHSLDFYLSSDNSPESQLQQFIDTYKPVSYTNDEIHHTYNLEGFKGNKPVNAHNMIRHFINKQRVFERMENHIQLKNVQYDVVLSLRMDLLFYNKFNFNNIEENTIYIPHGNDFEGGVNDQVAYGSISVMRFYMNILNNVLQLLDTGKSELHPENLNLANIVFNNVKISRVHVSYAIEYKLLQNKLNRIKDRIYKRTGKMPTHVIMDGKRYS